MWVNKCADQLCLIVPVTGTIMVDEGEILKTINERMEVDDTDTNYLVGVKMSAL